MGKRRLGAMGKGRWLDARASVPSLVALLLVLTVLGVAALNAPPVSIAAAGTSPSVASLMATPSGDASSTETSPSVEPTPLASVVRPLSRGAYIGIFRPPVPFNPAPLDTYKSLAGKPASMVMWFQPWSSKGANRFDTAAAVSVWQRGAVPIIVWEPWSPGDKPHDLSHPADMPDWKLSKIAAGQYDDYIRSFARDIKTAGGPVMISLFHEMNGVWYPWCGTVNGNSPATFVAAWRHVHDLFAEEGATNVTWLWSINFESRPPGWRNRYAAYYPGNKYVDWVGVSGFNWGRGVGGGPWKSFEKIYHTPLKYLRYTRKPVMITEFASVENGDSKPGWLSNAFKRIRTAHPEIKAVIYYDAKEYSHRHTQDWRINSSRRSLKAYRYALSSRYFVGGQTGSLSGWRGSLTATRWAEFLAIPRRY